jgi:hypothetical protein
MFIALNKSILAALSLSMDKLVSKLDGNHLVAVFVPNNSIIAALIVAE